MINFNNLFNKRGQATTEVVLLFPLFLLFIVFMAKILSLLVLVQKMEIASAYAARRWQLESHINIGYSSGWDQTFLKKDIEKKVADYIGMNSPTVKNFLNLESVELVVRPTAVWQELTLIVNTKPTKNNLICKYDRQKVCEDESIRKYCFDGYDYLCSGGRPMKVKKSVPNRDRPYPFVLPTVK